MIDPAPASLPIALAEVPAVERFLGESRVAYFSMEIALSSRMHTYSGGLGVLAGDTALACADLELPMVFVTLISRQGYLRQEIDADGRQQTLPDPWQPSDCCAVPLRAKVMVLIAGHEVWLCAWLHVLESPVGSAVPVLLLDTDLPENAEADRRITDTLYIGDPELRLRQEIVLGIGGLHLLSALGFQIGAYHLNDSHAALLALALLRKQPRPAGSSSDNGLRYDTAPVREICIFTTHTPLDAGHERFSYALFEQLLPGYFETEQLQRLVGADHLNMTRLALELSGFVNGVAVRHAETATRMFPGYVIRAITNGVHVPRWAHPAFCELFNQHASDWGINPEVMLRFDSLHNEDVWAAHSQAKADLLALIERSSGQRFDPSVATLGFARRMTAYKRPELLFTDLDRLRRIHSHQPFQLVMAGKAHPSDHAGQTLIQQLHQSFKALSGGPHMVFLANYDLDIARAVVAGVDVWLNTPEPPLEASGTSGMKAAVNGVLNLSVLDGWWLEACIEGTTGWAIGNGEQGRSLANAEHLYGKLEHVVLPAYYGNRGRWSWMMKQAIAKIASYFNSHRMMRRYAAEAYFPHRTLRRGPSYGS